METKKCPSCNEEKGYAEFFKDKSRKDGHGIYCKPCKSANDGIKSYGKHKRAQELSSQGKQCCRACKAVKNLSEYYKDKSRRNGHEPVCKQCRQADKSIKERQKEYKEKNKDIHRDYSREYLRKRRAEDPAFRLYKNVRTRVAQTLKEFGEHKKNKVKTNKEYYNKYFSVLNYSPEDLVEHIERQWIEGWDWNNYGEVWVVDHIYPHSKLPYDSIEHPNYKKAWALRNLRPLSKEDNSSKGAKVLGEYDDITLVVE